ncbi:MAG: type 4a pilus biogenesis protein PilO [Thermodesulfobacteriota bacterium]
MKKSDSPKPWEQALEKIGQLSRIQRILIAVGLCVVAIGLTVWLAYLPAIQSMDTLSTEITDLNQKLADAIMVANKYEEFKAKKEAQELEFRKGRLLLPDAKEIPSLLDAISRRGKESGLDFVLFEPKPEVAGSTFAEMPVSMEVIGSYHNIATFFDKLSKLTRLVNVKDMRIKPQAASPGGGPASQLQATLNAVTYRFLEKGDTKSDGSKSADNAKTDGSKKG